MPNLKESFLLDPEIVFLNHGSFGACPGAVFETYQAWQRRLERQPVLFLGRQLSELQRTARQALGEFVGAEADDLVFIPNATYGVNLVARSLALQPGDEILTTDHEYGACDKAWKFICSKRGAHYRQQPITLPVASPQSFLEQFWQGVTPRTRLVYLSHITSPTAQRFPIEAICQRARQKGILTLIDGAHTPGQIALDLEAIGADFYTGNCHKWMLSPKGAGFLYTQRQAQALIEPLVVSWGYQAAEEMSSGSRFIDLLEWSGTHDPAAALSVQAAIEFMHEHDWARRRQDCTTLLLQALQRIGELTGLPGMYPSLPGLAPHSLPPQMGIAALPAETDLAVLKMCLYDDYRVEAPLIEWNNERFIRISVQCYNSQADIDRLLEALAALLPVRRTTDQLTA
jgi:isopenicillin-N epimerase